MKLPPGQRAGELGAFSISVEAGFGWTSKADRLVRGDDHHGARSIAVHARGSEP